jgi:hypothetical protein
MAGVDALAQLIAVDEIEALKARYFRHLDAQEWSELRALYTDDAQFEFPAIGTFPGPDACIEVISGALTGTTTVHHGHTPEIEVTGPDTATGVWSLTDHVIRDQGSGGAVPGYPAQLAAGHRGYLRQTETYRRGPSGWRIAGMRAERILIEPLAAG